MEKIKKVVAIAMLLLFVAFFINIISKGKPNSSNPNNTDNTNNTELVEGTDYNEDADTKPGVKKYDSVTSVPDGYVGIYTVDDLLKISINLEYNYILMSDLDLSDFDDWSGIRNDAIFDGNGHTIYNLRSSDSGLFIACNDVRNLLLKNVEMNLITTEYSYVGSIANLVKGNLSNCYAEGNIVVCSSSTRPKALSHIEVGGLVGECTGSISYCTNNIQIDCDTRNFFDSNLDIECGGIAGRFRSENLTLTISNCVNFGLIDIYSKHYENDYYMGTCGGIVGVCQIGTNIIDCVNYGDVYSSQVASGIVAEIYYYRNEKTDIVNCKNFGTISLKPLNIYLDEYACAGIVGSAGTGLTGKGEININSCHSIGELNNNSLGSSGEMVAYFINTTLNIEECVYVNNADYNGFSVNIDGKGGMYPESSNNKNISLSEAYKLYPNLINNG